MTPNMAASSQLLFSLLVFSLLQWVSSESNGLIIKLIHRDSVESPLYPGNISTEERLLRLGQQMEAKLEQIQFAFSGGIHPNAPQTNVTTNGFYYVTEVGIGTFPGDPDYQSSFLVVDTGSNMIWAQCEGCDPCYAQESNKFQYTQSSSYQPVPCQQNTDCAFDFANGCIQGRCEYRVAYGARYSEGPYAQERFTFQSTTGVIESLNLDFGCGLRNNFPAFGSPGFQKIGGVFGMGTGPTSLLRQLGPRSNGRFMVCLQSSSNNQGIGVGINTFLRFGDAAALNKFRANPPPFATPLADFNGHLYVTLPGISVNGARLNIPPEAFAPRPGGKGGCVVDLGSPLTLMKPAQYNVVKAAMQHHFSKFVNVPQVRPPISLFDLCYRVPIDFNSFPHMEFHLRDANLRFTASEVFFFLDNSVFCLAFIPFSPTDDAMDVLLGNHLLTNRRILFDVPAQKMYYQNAICSLDSGIENMVNN